MAVLELHLTGCFGFCPYLTWMNQKRCFVVMTCELLQEAVWSLVSFSEYWQVPPLHNWRVLCKNRLSWLSRFFRPQLSCILRYDDGSLDGVTGAFVMFSSTTCCLRQWPLISFRVFFSYIVRIIYDGLLTLSKYLFLIVCWVILIDKNTSNGVCSVYTPTNASDLSTFTRVDSI